MGSRNQNGVQRDWRGCGGHGEEGAGRAQESQKGETMHGTSRTTHGGQQEQAETSKSATMVRICEMDMARRVHGHLKNNGSGLARIQHTYADGSTTVGDRPLTDLKRKGVQP